VGNHTNSSDEPFRKKRFIKIRKKPCSSGRANTSIANTLLLYASSEYRLGTRTHTTPIPFKTIILSFYSKPKRVSFPLSLHDIINTLPNPRQSLLTLVSYLYPHLPILLNNVRIRLYELRDLPCTCTQ